MSPWRFLALTLLGSVASHVALGLSDSALAVTAAFEVVVAAVIWLWTNYRVVPR